MDIERLVVKITADASQYTHVMQAVEARLVAFSGIVTTALVGMSVRLAAQFERASIAFEVMMGDATKAQRILGEVVQMALETPFHSSELIEAAKQLRAFGFAGDEIMPVLRALANVSSGTGAELNRVALAFGQVRVAGRLMGAELRQFINAGVPLIEELAKELDKPRELIASMVHEGQIGWPEVVRAFNRMTTAGGLYAGMNERINRETVSGQWEQFTETLQVVARNFGGALLKGLGVRDVLASLSDALTMNQVTVNAWTNAFDEIREVLVETSVGIRVFYEIIRESPFADYVVTLFEIGLALRMYTIAVGFATLAWRAFLIVFNVTGLTKLAAALWGVSAALFSIARAVLLMKLGAAVAAVIAFAISWGPLIAQIVIAGIVLYKLFIILRELEVFDKIARFLGTIFEGLKNFLGAVFAGSGSALSEAFSKISSAFSTAWEGIKAAVGSGDLKAAIAIAFKGVEYGWAVTVKAMEVEFRRFWFNVSNMVRELWLTFKIEVFGFLAESPLQSPVGKASFSLMKAKAEMELAQPRGQAEFDARMKAIMESAGAKELAALNAMSKAATNPPPKNYMEVLHARGGVMGGLAFGGGVDIPPEFMSDSDKAEYNKFLFAYKIYGPGGNRSFTLASLQAAGFKNPREVEEFLRTYTRPQIPNYGGGSAGGIPTQISVSSFAKQQAEAVQHELLARGRGPYDLFSTTMKNLAEAYQGPVNQPGLMGLVGGMAAGGVKNIGSILSTPEFEFGSFKAYDELRRSLGQPASGRLPPTMLRGSQEAQDTINRSLTQTTSVEQDILTTLTEAKEIQARQEEYQKQAAEYLKKLAETGVITGK